MTGVCMCKTYSCCVGLIVVHSVQPAIGIVIVVCYLYAYINAYAAESEVQHRNSVLNVNIL